MFGMSLETAFQAGTMAVGVASFFTALGIWFRYGPDRHRASNEEKVIDNAEVASRLREFRAEVHALRNELQAVSGELHAAQSQSQRRGDKLNMVLFILKMVMDELSAKDPGNVVLRNAKTLLERVEADPNGSEKSRVLRAAEDTVSTAQRAVHEIKANEVDDEEDGA